MSVMRYAGGLGMHEVRNWRDYKRILSAGEVVGLATVGGDLYSEVLIPAGSRFVLNRIQVGANGVIVPCVLFLVRSTAAGMAGVKTRLLTYYSLGTGVTTRAYGQGFSPILSWYNNTGVNIWFQVILPTAATTIRALAQNAITEYVICNCEYFLYPDIATATLIHAGGMGLREIRNLSRVLLHVDSGEIIGDAAAAGTNMISIEVPAGRSLSIVRIGLGFAEAAVGDWLVNIVNSSTAGVGGVEIPIACLEDTGAAGLMHTELGDGINMIHTIDNRLGVVSRWLQMNIPLNCFGAATNNQATNFAAGDITYLLE